MRAGDVAVELKNAREEAAKCAKEAEDAKGEEGLGGAPAAA